MTDDIAAIAAGLSERAPVPGYEGFYEIARDGHVYALERTISRMNRGRVQSWVAPSRKLARTFSRKGYPQVSLHRDGVSRTFEVHRLVCRVFHGEPASGMEAAHLDGDKTNPSADNLIWATRRENHAHKKLHGTHLSGEQVPNAVLTPAKANEAIHAWMRGETKYSIAERLGVNEATIRSIISGRTWAKETLAVRQHLMEQSHD